MGNDQVAAKQILIHGNVMWMIDAAGQLWWSDDFDHNEDGPTWVQVDLPSAKEA
jgi:hypothetical protein